MAQKTISMDLAQQVRQLSIDKVPIKEITRRVGLTRKTVKKYLRAMQLLPSQVEDNSATVVSDKELAVIIYNNDVSPLPGKRIENLIKHFEDAKNELHKPGVKKQMLWAEYLSEYADGYKYSQYCRLFMKFLKNSDPAFHWEYTPGEFIQVDFAGKKLSYIDKRTDEVVWCQVFVGILPFSGLIFCKAVASQKISDFVHCINEMLKYMGGVTKTILCDNLKTAVTRADRFEPVFTEICYRLSDHYNTTFSATRPAKPTDKGMIENAVNIIYTNIYAPFRNETPGSLEDLNGYIRKWLDILNVKPYKGNSESRRDIFERNEKAVLKELPASRFLSKKQKEVTLQRNYYIQLPDNGHYYSAPFEYIGQKLGVYYDERSVEIYFNNERIAIHGRSSTEAKYVRILEHMPANHQHMEETRGWTIEELLRKAGWVGEYTRQTAKRIIHSSIYPEQNYKACNAMIMLQKKYTKQRLENACRRASNVARPTLKLIRNILETGLDKVPELFDEDKTPTPRHGNIRGPKEYK